MTQTARQQRNQLFQIQQQDEEFTNTTARELRALLFDLAEQDQPAPKILANKIARYWKVKVAHEQREATVFSIAVENFGLETLETRNSDSLDFSEQAVWTIKSALRKAYDAGKISGKITPAEELFPFSGPSETTAADEPSDSDIDGMLFN